MPVNVSFLLPSRVRARQCALALPHRRRGLPGLALQTSRRGLGYEFAQDLRTVASLVLMKSPANNGTTISGALLGHLRAAWVMDLYLDAMQLSGASADAARLEAARESKIFPLWRLAVVPWYRYVSAPRSLSTRSPPHHWFSYHQIPHGLLNATLLVCALLNLSVLIYLWIKHVLRRPIAVALRAVLRAPVRHAADTAAEGGHRLGASEPQPQARYRHCRLPCRPPGQPTPPPPTRHPQVMQPPNGARDACSCAYAAQAQTEPGEHGRLWQRHRPHGRFSGWHVLAAYTTAVNGDAQPLL